MSPSPNNPFKPAEQVEPKAKLLVFGVPGAGKSYLALSAPGRVAVIDTEGGTAFYAGRPGLSEFDVLHTKTYRDVKHAIEYLAAHPGDYETLVIDPVTVIYDTLQEAAAIARARRRGVEDADLEMLDWSKIKRHYKAMMTALVNLPMHVVVTAREKDEYEKRGSEMVKIGVKPDAEKGTAYNFDTVIRLVPTDKGRIAVVQKDRTGPWDLGDRIENPTFMDIFGEVIAKPAKGRGRKKAAVKTKTVADDQEAAEIDAEEVIDEKTTPALAASAAELLVGAGVDIDAFLRKRGLGSLMEATPDQLRRAMSWAAERQQSPAEAVAEAHAAAGSDPTPEETAAELDAADSAA